MASVVEASSGGVTCAAGATGALAPESTVGQKRSHMEKKQLHCVAININLEERGGKGTGAHKAINMVAEHGPDPWLQEVVDATYPVITSTGKTNGLTEAVTETTADEDGGTGSKGNTNRLNHRGQNSDSPA